MEHSQRDRLRERVREIIAQKAGVKGGFLHLLPTLLPAALSALPTVIDIGKKLFGSGKHNQDAKTRKPNAHAIAVKRILAECKARGKPITLGEASKLAKEIRNAGNTKPRKNARKMSRNRKDE